MVNQSKLHSFCTALKYKYGYKVPKDFKHAMELDIQNRNALWCVATALKLAQLYEYNNTFKDLGYQAKAPAGYKKIQTHIIYNCMHDGRHKAQMATDGHLTDVYFGVVSL